MFNYKKIGGGVIDGYWVVFFIDEHGDDVNMYFTNYEEKAFEKAKYLNDILKSFIRIIKNL